MNKENKENLIPVKGLSPFKRFCMTIGELPSSYLETMTYYEMLVWFTKYLQDTVIPTINNNASAVEELQNKYIEFTDNLLDRQTTFENNLTERQENYEEEVMTLFNNLQDFVNNYFNNLDVQEEINNKLDEMADEGILQEIIADYLNSKAIFGFDNVSDMKDSTNLIDGSYARTLGYYNKGDGGSAIYKIRTMTNDDVIDEMFILEMTANPNLVAEIVIEDCTINVDKLGAYGDNTHNDYNILNTAIQKANTTGYKLIGNKNYLIDNTLNIHFNNMNIFLNKINYNGIGSAISIKGTDNNIKINTLTSSGVGLYLTCDNNTMSKRNSIIVDIINSTEHGIYFFSDTWGIYENEVKFKQINISGNNYNGINIISDHSETHNTSYINQNFFYGGRIDGAVYGVYADASQGQINELICYGISCESSINGIYLKDVTDSSFENFRLEELTNESGHLYMKLVGNSRNNNFRFNRYTPLELIDTSELTSSYNSPNTVYSNIRDNRQGNYIGTILKFWGDGIINITDPALKSKNITGDTTLGSLEYVNLFNVQNTVTTCTITLNKMYNDNGVNTFYVYKRSGTTSITLKTYDESNSLEITRNGLNMVKFIGSMQIVQ